MEDKGLIPKLRKRRIWRVLIAYPVMTFGLLEAVEFFISNYGLDSRWLTTTIILAACLLPAAVLWNWRHGEEGEQAFARPEIGAYVISAIAAFGLSAWFFSTTEPGRQVFPTQPQAQRIAVLPFENVAADGDIQYLCDGIAESLINWLSGLDDLKVIAKNTSFRMRDETDLATIAKTLGVDALLRGRLERVGNQWVASVALTDVRDESQLWGERVVQESNDILALEKSIVSAIQSGLEVELNNTGDETLEVGGTDSPEAYEHYLRGHFLIQSTNSHTINAGLEELREAIKVDPSFARPYADIADSLSQQVSYGVLNDPQLIGEAKNAAYTAVALGPDLAESYTAMGTVQQFIELDWAAVDKAYETAISLNPGSTAPFHRYSDWLVLTGRYDRAREVASRGMAVDPLDSSMLHGVGLIELIAANFDLSAEKFGDWNRFYPNSTWSFVKHAVALSLADRCDEAKSQSAIAVQRSGDNLSSLMASWLAWGYHVCGNTQGFEQMKAVILPNGNENRAFHDPGVVYLAAIEGDAEFVIEAMTNNWANRRYHSSFTRIFGLDYLGWDVAGKVAADPRFQTLLQDIDLPKSGLQ